MKITISNPCRENLQLMKISKAGYLCEVCKKEVVDFTKFSDNELIDKIKNKNAFCGKFRTNQLEYEFIDKRISRKLIQNWFGISISAFTLFINQANCQNIKELNDFKPVIGELELIDSSRVEVKPWFLKIKVVDDKTLKPISATKIIISDTEYKANLKGEFSILIKTNSTDINIVAKGYYEKRQVFDKFNLSLNLVKVSKIQKSRKNEEIFGVFEQSAEFPGGTVEMYKFLKENIQYPRFKFNHKNNGFVLVKFKVNKNGIISNIGIVKSLGYAFDEEAKRVISLMPKWIPARMYNERIDQWYNIKVRF